MTNRRHRHRLCPAILVAVVTIAGTACGDGDASGTSPPDDECGLVELDTLDSAIDVAGELGGETVADTEIHYTDGDDMVSLGGLDVTMPMLADLDYYYDPHGRDITTPPSWPTLSHVQLHSGRSPSGDPTIGLVVFAQTTSVSADGCRQELFDAYWEKARFTEADTIHQSETTNSETGVTCWTEVRYGSVGRFDPEHQSVTLFAGPGIGSSGVIMWAPGEYTEIPDNTGDLVEAVCGTRPDGL